MFGRDRSLTSLLNDTFIRGILFQALIAIGLLLSINWLADNTLSNLANQGKTLGFDFLTRTAGFQISPTLGTWMLDYKVGKSTYTDVYLIGIINTFIVALLGILAATVIGFTVGIMRLSDNLVFRWFSSFYVEVVRNVPLLLQLFFWYFAVLRAMPSKREKLELVEGVAGLNITGLYLPAPIVSDGFIYSFLSLIGAIAITFLVRRYALRRQAETGQILPMFWIGLGIIITSSCFGALFEWQPVRLELA